MGKRKLTVQNKLFILGTSYAVCFAAAGVGSAFTMPSIPTWYAGLNKPFFNPPNWIFGPVWTLLYSCMAIALYQIRIHKTAAPQASQGILFFSIQLILNTLWSIVFFGMKSPSIAFSVIVALWLLIYLTIRAFLSVQKIAAYLLIPYLLWVTFAMCLNVSIVILN